MNRSRLPLRIVVAVFLGGWVAGGASALAADEDVYFPFLPTFESPENITNASAWLPRPAGAAGFVRVSNGRLVVGYDGTHKTERPIRFWATNTCFSANFPDRQQAERVAARLARLGINCVRLHHMDSRDIWGKSPNKTTIDPEQLARLDYFIYQLKQHGIYVNINLHVSRTLGPKEGFPDDPRRPKYDKGIDNFHQPMIELQKKYARDLLTHVNPHTNTAYTDEPAVAFVEINNENALFQEWGNRALDDLPEPYAGDLRKQWNAWLRKKYGTTEALRKAWSAGEHPFGDELLSGGDFATWPAPRWNVERDSETGVEVKAEKGGPEGANKLRIQVTKIGKVAWNPQLTCTGFGVKKGMPYTLSFAVRSNEKSSISVGVKQAHAPWGDLGLAVRIETGPQWSVVRRTFVAKADDEQARVSITNFSPGVYELAQVSLRPGGVLGLPKDQRLDDDSVATLKRGESNATEAAQADFIQFLWDTEHAYWTGMYRFLKDELKVKSLVAGTQLGWSPVYVQAALDYIDAHSYWQHPRFPGRPWDPENWTVRNTALVNEPAGTLGGLAAKRVLGMAYTVSEYNHPAPNQYRGEGLPMIAAFGALQGWDGVFSFAYSHNAEFELPRIQGYFDIRSDPCRLVHSPACAAMFLRGDVRPADKIAWAPLSKQREQELLREGNNARKLTTGDLGLDPRVAIERRIGLAIETRPPRLAMADATTAPQTPEEANRALSAAAAQRNAWASDTGEVLWDTSEKGAGCFIVNAPRSKLFTGFVRGRTFELGGVKLAVGKTVLDWTTVTLTCIDGKGFDQPGRILLALSGDVKNTGAKLEHLPNQDVTLRRNWGREPVLCEGIPAELTLPVPAERVEVFALDPSGEPTSAVPVENRHGKAVVAVGPKWKTLWYEIRVK